MFLLYPFLKIIQIFVDFLFALYDPTMIEDIEEYFKMVSPTIRVMRLANSDITHLPDLSKFTHLSMLDCGRNRIAELPKLPDSLRALYCSENAMKRLPDVLPPFLEILSCYNNELTELPTLPKTLKQLFCFGNRLRRLPELPHSIQRINVIYNQLRILPELPETMTEIYCSHNHIRHLPCLPNNLSELHCNNNFLTDLPPLPPNLNLLNCQHNQISKMPELPTTMMYFNCSNNWLKTLPELPNGLYELSCESNHLISLPVLPKNLELLLCGHNKLTVLPELPEKVRFLYCNHNQLRQLPYFHNHPLFGFHFEGNPLELYDVLSRIASIDDQRRVSNQWYLFREKYFQRKYKKSLRDWLWRIREKRVREEMHPDRIRALLENVADEDLEKRLDEIFENIIPVAKY